jgi:hypothetical protein
VGSLLRPYAWIIEPGLKQGAPLEYIHKAVKQAGHQLISEGKMKEETLFKIAGEILPRDEVITMMQRSFGDK